MAGVHCRWSLTIRLHWTPPCCVQFMTPRWCNDCGSIFCAYLSSGGTWPIGRSYKQTVSHWVDVCAGGQSNGRSGSVGGAPSQTQEPGEAIIRHQAAKGPFTWPGWHCPRSPACGRVTADSLSPLGLHTGCSIFHALIGLYTGQPQRWA